MADLIDIIMEKLSPAALEALDEIDLEPNPVSRAFSSELQTMLGGMETAYLDSCTDEINNATTMCERKTQEMERLLCKFRKQLETCQRSEAHGDPSDYEKKLKMYQNQIQGVERTLRELTGKSSEHKPDQVFADIEELHKSNESLELKIMELKKKLKYYEDFPTNIQEAEYCITAIQERIQKAEALLMGNNCNKMGTG